MKKIVNNIIFTTITFKESIFSNKDMLRLAPLSFVRKIIQFYCYTIGYAK